ncbi:hypothetical protein QR680_009912 [Steinernema hermaphroditum]|uniref:Uncharacterized protein n=1 Tax=Steinernema hermaphroditum TaxID=289476 RepID=A0AA39INR3_9BILA|nr:hypothetical protein QR680_009912 [Steinernema hermaphroditum]
MGRQCDSFKANVFCKLRCQNCYKTKDQHSEDALEKSKECTDRNATLERVNGFLKVARAPSVPELTNHDDKVAPPVVHVAANRVAIVSVPKRRPHESFPSASIDFGWLSNVTEDHVSTAFACCPLGRLCPSPLDRFVYVCTGNHGKYWSLSVPPTGARPVRLSMRWAV